ncbi:hypothetical protein KEM56_000800, partial [Ascosphaera pollenicola]
HLAVITTILHRCLMAGDYLRAGRAWGLILRDSFAGTPVQVKYTARWGIGAEILLWSDFDRKSVQPPPYKQWFTRKGFEKAKDYYERLILQYPYSKSHPHSLNPLDFYPAMFGLWISIAQEESRAAREANPDGEDEDEDKDDSLMELGLASDIGDVDVAPRRRHDGRRKEILTARSSELAEAEKIATELDKVLLSPPYSDSPRLLELRGMILQWVGDLHVSSVTADDPDNMPMPVDDLEHVPALILPDPCPVIDASVDIKPTPGASLDLDGDIDMASSASSSSLSNSDPDYEFGDSPPPQTEPTSLTRPQQKLVQTVIRMKRQNQSESAEQEAGPNSSEDQQQQQQQQQQHQQITQTPPSIPLKRPNTDLDLSPPTSTSRAAPARSGNDAVPELGSEDEMSVEDEPAPLEQPKGKGQSKRERRKQLEDQRSDEKIRMIFGGDASADVRDLWLGKDTKWELLSAWDSVTDKDFSLAPFGDPFSLAFGTSKAGGDGIPRFRFPDSSRYMNQFMIHASLDILEELQWTNGAMYLKNIDSYSPSSCYISAFLTGSGARFLLLHQPHSTAVSNSSASSSSTPLTTRASSSSIANNPLSPQAEEAVRQFMNEVYENWVKAVMSPFYRRGAEIKSPVFRQRIVAAGRKWL